MNPSSRDCLPNCSFEHLCVGKDCKLDILRGNFEPHDCLPPTTTPEVEDMLLADFKTLVQNQILITGMSRKEAVRCSKSILLAWYKELLDMEGEMLIKSPGWLT